MRLSILLLLLACIQPAQAHLIPAGLQCDGLINPTGVDAVPRFSWKLGAPAAVRGARQTAWQLQVGDWDSGRIESSEQIAIPYAGPPLLAHQKVDWRVRVWDEANEPSPWSETQTFTVGAVTPADWGNAQWITDAELLRWQRSRLGFSSQVTANADEAKWIQLDLGTVQPIEAVRLYAVQHTELENLGFPDRLKLEASNEPDFRVAQILVDQTRGQRADSWRSVIEIPTKGASARYLRLVVPHLRVDAGRARLALSQIEVISGGRNIAPRSRVTASDSIEDDRWSRTAVVDGLEASPENVRANGTLLLRRDFTVRSPLRRALLHVSGLGQYEFELNGCVKSSARLTPGWTDYDKTVLYDSYDVTSALQPGANAIGLTLASGMYNVQRAAGRYTKFVGPFRPLKAIALLRLEYADGSLENVVTDDRWTVSPGPTTFAHIYGGEDYDARLQVVGWSSPGFDASSWSAATVTTAPGGTLRGASHSSPAFATFETLVPVASRGIRPGVTVYDLAQNASLMLSLKVTGPRGSRVKVVPAELLNPDGTVDRHSSSHGGAEASWNYTLRGPNGTVDGAEDWRPTFFYHGSRYLQVECMAAPDGGLAPQVEAIQGLVAHSDSPPAGEFACSSELFNRIHGLIRWAQRSNLAHVITDCPHRERLGWLEQYHLNGPSLRYEWDLSRLYGKCFGDMADAQTEDGMIPDIAPEYVKFSGGFRDSPEWGSAFILAPWQHYVWTGDDAPLRRHYEGMKRYAAYLEKQRQDGLIQYGLGDWYDLGPRPPGRSQLTPIALTATAIYYEDLVTLARVARHLGREHDATEFVRRASEIKAVFNRAFLDESRGLYAGGSQTAQALPLAVGLVPDESHASVVASLVRDLRDRGNTGGDVGYRYVLRALAENGQSELIFAMNNQSSKPGYGYQLARGATSLTEAWDANPASSQNHFMLGQIMEWYYGDLAGLAPDPEGPGFARVRVAPTPVAGIDWARAVHESPRGRVAVEWRKSEGKLTVEVELPPNTTASVELPATVDVITEGGRRVGTDSTVKFLGRKADRAVVAIPAGHFVFSMPCFAP